MDPIQNGDVEAARRVINAAADAVRRLGVANQDAARMKSQIDSLRSEMRKGTIVAGQRTWTSEQVERLRSEYADRGLLLEEVADAFEFIDDLVPDLRPTARRALQDIRKKVDETVGRNHR